MAESSSADPWAWLGLLKWTLNQQKYDTEADPDFSDAKEPPVPMSDEDKAFLEKVMKEGLVNEGDRMKDILLEFATAMEGYQKNGGGADAVAGQDDDDEQHLQDLLLELRDIVEQIDYAQAFVNIKGLHYLLGAIQQTSAVPQSIRNSCLGLVSTLAQNNPPVQKALLELGALKTFSDLFLDAIQAPLEDDDAEVDAAAVAATTSTYLTKLMQAMSATVRDYNVSESVFEHLPQAPSIMAEGLAWNNGGKDSDSTFADPVHSKTLFFLSALLSSDSATTERANLFSQAVQAIVTPPYARYLDHPTSVLLRESSVGLLRQLLERKFATSLVWPQKQNLAALGVQRIRILRAEISQAQEAKEEEFASDQELKDWESALLLLARMEAPSTTTPLSQ